MLAIQMTWPQAAPFQVLQNHGRLSPWHRGGICGLTFCASTPSTCNGMQRPRVIIQGRNNGSHAGPSDQTHRSQQQPSPPSSFKRPLAVCRRWTLDTCITLPTSLLPDCTSLPYRPPPTSTHAPFSSQTTSKPPLHARATSTTSTASERHVLLFFHRRR